MADTKSEENPTLSLNQEEATIIRDSIKSIDNKSVVYDRLIMKIDKVIKYWENVDRARHLKQEQIAKAMIEVSKTKPQKIIKK